MKFETTPLDWFNYTAQEYNSNALIRYVLRFDSRLDYRLLEHAVGCCMVAEPLLGFLFKPEDDVPEWVPAGRSAADMCSHVTGDNEDMEAILAERTYADRECPFRVALISEKEGDILVVTLHHALCDGRGALNIVRLLAEMYTALEQDACFMPVPQVHRRSTDAFYEYFGFGESMPVFDPSELDMESTWGIPVGNAEVPQSFRFSILRLGNQRLEAIRTFAKRNGGSVNATLTAAYHRALVQLLNPAEDAKEIQFTVDLRKYSKKGNMNSACNLSTILNANLPVSGNMEFLVHAAKTAIDKVLRPEHLVQSLLSCEMMRPLGFKASAGFYESDWEKVKSTGLCTPMISNMGRLDGDGICFGRIAPADMYLVPPAFVGPSFMMGASTFDDVLTLCSSYYDPSTDSGFVSSLLERVSRILCGL
ncbi:MAG: hypothetical protein LKK19_02210 [Bacteroidales bacterium]|nr:hypothetical protein [Bacteroidales bacterium]MCI2121498.1 hypothetical protein [Bacteroidales bacterium]MCI2145137.1 hypothetical protein [Bacteroidales bacterium]